MQQITPNKQNHMYDASLVSPNADAECRPDLPGIYIHQNSDPLIFTTLKTSEYNIETCSQKGFLYF